MVKSISVCQ